MYKWRLLLLASFAVFQPTATFAERNLVDGRQQCCDRLPSSLRRDTKLAVYGTYRVDKFSSENRNLRERREISQTRRNEIRGLDTETRSTGDVSRQTLDRQIRITRDERRPIQALNIRDSRQRLSPDGRENRDSLFRLSRDDVASRAFNGRQSRISDSERLNQFVRDNSQTVGSVTNSRNGRRVARDVEFDRRSYLSQAGSRSQIDSRDRFLVDQRARINENRVEISAPKRSVVERRMDTSRLLQRMSRDNENRVPARHESTTSFVENAQRRLLSNQRRVTRNTVYRNTRTEQQRDERRNMNQDKRIARDTIDVNRRLTNQREQESPERITGIRQDERYLNRIELRSVSQVDRRAERNSRDVDRRLISRSLDRRDSLMLGTRKTAFDRRTREESRNDVRFERDNARNILNRERHLTSDRLIENNYREQIQSPERREINNENRRSTAREESREFRNIDLNTREIAKERIDSRSRMSRSQSDTRENRYSVQRSRSEQSRRISERRVIEQIRNEVSRPNLPSDRIVERRSRVDDRRMEREDKLNARVSRERSIERREVHERIIRDQRPAERSSPLNAREREANAASRLNRITRERETSATRLVESQLTRDRETQRNRENRWSQQNRDDRVTRDREASATRLVESQMRDRETRRENRWSQQRHDDRVTRDREASSTRLVESQMRDRKTRRDRESRWSQHNRDDRITRDREASATRLVESQMRDRETRLENRWNQRNRDDLKRVLRSRVSVTIRSRDINSATEKDQAFNVFTLNWQYVFYTLQSIYILGIILQMLNNNGATNKKAKSFRWWDTAVRSPIKMD